MADTPGTPSGCGCLHAGRHQPPGGFAGQHPATQFYDRGEPAPAEDFDHVIGDGYVIVRYTPDLPDEQVGVLRTLVEGGNETVVAGEDPGQAQPLKAYTAVRELICERFDADALQKFTSTLQADLAAGEFG